MCNLKNKIKPVESKRIQGFVNLLTKKGFIDDENKLTEKGLKLVETCIAEQPDRKLDFKDWVVLLHKRCQEKLTELTGSNQVRASINKGPAYSFLPNSKDLETKLEQFIKYYKYKDFEKIEKSILSHVEKCHAKDNWFPLIQYYIMKDKFSPMMTDIQMPQEEVSTGGASTQKFI